MATKFMVKYGHSLSVTKDGKEKSYVAGDQVDFSDEEVKQYGDALEPYDGDASKEIKEKAKADAEAAALAAGTTAPTSPAAPPSMPKAEPKSSETLHTHPEKHR